MASGQTAGTSRREEYAVATKRAIVRSARQLFSERGYFATKVDDIAAVARVAPATVYAVSGGKQGLLRTLTDTAVSDPMIAATIKRIEDLKGKTLSVDAMTTGYAFVLYDILRRHGLDKDRGDYEIVRAGGMMTPAYILDEINEILGTETPLWMTMAIGIFDPSGRTPA